jgi:hypothetical protein
MAGTANAGASTAANGGDGGVKEQAQQKAQDVREQAGEQVRQATGQAVDQRSTQPNKQVHQHASDLRDVAQQLREQGKDGPAKIADQVADRAQRAGSWMKESDADRILSDVEDFARSNPWAIAAGGLALGFAASRLLKASSSQRYEQRGTTITAGQLPPAGGTTVPVAEPVRTPPLDDPLHTPPLDDPLRTPSPGGGL